MYATGPHQTSMPSQSSPAWSPQTPEPPHPCHAPPPLPSFPPPRAEPQDKKSSRWALGQWLGDAAASEALAAVQAANKAKQAAVPPKGDDSPCLYMDEEGNAHLGVRPGDDREIFNAMRQLQVRGR